MKVDLFDFALPPERIALRPAEPRDAARLQLAKQRRVVLVGQLVGGKMLRLQRDGAPQRLLPLGRRLAGNGKDEIEVEIVEAGLAQHRHALVCHCRGMDAAETLQQLVIE